MPPAGFLARKPAIGELVAERLQELDLGVGQVDEDHGDAVVGLVLRGADPRAERVAVLRRGGGEVGHRDGDVVEPADHPEFPAKAETAAIRGFALPASTSGGSFTMNLSRCYRQTSEWLWSGRAPGWRPYRVELGNRPAAAQ